MNEGKSNVQQFVTYICGSKLAGEYRMWQGANVQDQRPRALH